MTTCVYSIYMYAISMSYLIFESESCSGQLLDLFCLFIEISYRFGGIPKIIPQTRAKLYIPTQIFKKVEEKKQVPSKLYTLIP